VCINLQRSAVTIFSIHLPKSGALKMMLGGYQGSLHKVSKINDKNLNFCH